MNIFTLFWLTGHSELIKGEDPQNAVMNAGYGAGAFRALDFYAIGDARDKYEWNSTENTWKKKGLDIGVDNKYIIVVD